MFNQAVQEIDAILPKSPKIRNGGSLLLMAGLPGSGKSSIVDELRPLMPFVVIGTDWVRVQLQKKPIYTATAQEKVYEVSYQLIVRRLNMGQRVVFDASNYLAARREHVVAMAEGCGAPVAIALVQASQETIRQRLLRRMAGQRHHGDLSDADWSVYKWMVEKQEPIVGPHIVLDTTDASPQKLAIELYRYWTQVETDAASNLNLQSPSWASKFVGYNQLSC